MVLMDWFRILSQYIIFHHSSDWYILVIFPTKQISYQVTPIKFLATFYFSAPFLTKYLSEEEDLKDTLPPICPSISLFKTFARLPTYETLCTNWYHFILFIYFFYLQILRFFFIYKYIVNENYMGLQFLK